MSFRILHRCSPFCFSISYWLIEIEVFKESQKSPPPQIMGKYWSDCTGQWMFSIRGQLQKKRKFSFKSVNVFVRYPLTFFSQTHTHTCQAKIHFSWRFSVSRIRLLARVRIFDGIPILRSTNMDVKKNHSTRKTSKLVKYICFAYFSALCGTIARRSS